MNLYYKLVVRNLSRNARIYSAYFFSLVISVSMFYVIKSTQYNETIQFLSTCYTTIKMGLAFASATVAIAVGVLILYSNIFFVRKRKKEVGLYTLMGMKHSKVAGLICVEVFIASLFALFVGLVIGELLSQLNYHMLIRLLEEDVQMKMGLSFEAVISTVQYFIGLTVVSIAVNTIFIYRVRVIELFKSESKNEKYIGKITYIQVILGILSLSALACGYRYALILSTDGYQSRHMATLLNMSFVLVVLGTFGCFVYGMPMILRGVQTLGPFYYRGHNLIVFRQVSHNIMTNAKMLGVMTLLISCTLGAMSTTMGLYHSQIAKSESQSPVSYIIDYENTPKPMLESVNSVLARHGGTNALVLNETIEFPLVSIQGHDEDFRFMSISEYNKIRDQIVVSEKMADYRKTTTLEKNEALFIPQMRRNKDTYEAWKGENISVGEISLTVKEVTALGIWNEFMPVEKTIVVSDSLLADIRAHAAKNVTTSFIIVENHDRADALTKDLSQILGSDHPAIQKSHYMTHKMNIADKTTFLFVGIYVSLIFLIASGSTLSIKQMTSALTDRQIFDIIQKLGIDDANIKIIIMKQLALIFFVPVALSVLHLSFALRFVSVVLEENIVYSVAVSAAAFATIYSVYYSHTVRAYYRLVVS